MKSQSSSIFSFDSRRYLRSLVAGIGLSVVAVYGISWLGVRFELIDHPDHVNYNFQLAKLAADPSPIDTLFVGDSSLGVLIDVDTWSKLRGKRGEHAALTGNYGYAGSVNMVRQSLAGSRPRNVVLFQTVDMMTRGPAYTGYILSLNGNGKEDVVPLTKRFTERVEYFFSLDIFLATIRGLAMKIIGRSSNYLDGSYVRIPNRVGAPGRIIPGQTLAILPSEIEPRKTLFLQEFAQLCRDEDLNCVYAHGPVYEEICNTSQDFIEAASALIEKHGLTVVPGTPVCVPQSDLADTLDHIRPELKQDYTQRYFELLSPYLR